MRLVVVFSLFFLSLYGRADEGIWVPLYLSELKQDLYAQGLEIPIERIYHPDSTSIKDAIVFFGSGCTGSIISNTGLLITNYHCSLSYIQELSTLENNYIEKGFWAKNHKEDIPIKGLTVAIPMGMYDVTAKIKEKVSDTINELERNRLLDIAFEELIPDSLKNNAFYKAEIKPLLSGNLFFLYTYQVFSDIRLVGAPSKYIGSFGGDTDNWEWPRHTGDFSLFRIYVDSINQPSAYQPNNRPYQPKTHIPIAKNGVKEHDFTMVYGFPGKTNEYISSFELEELLTLRIPIRTQVREKKMALIKEQQAKNDTVNLMYLSEMAYIANGYKKWLGQAQGLKKAQAIEKLKQFEKAFNLYTEHDSIGKTYLTTLHALDILFYKKKALTIWQEFFFESVWQTDLIRLANSLSQLGTLEGDQLEQQRKHTLDLIHDFYNTHHIPTEKTLFSELIADYYTQTYAQTPPYWLFKKWHRQPMLTTYIARKIVAPSLLAHPEKLKQFITDYQPKDKEKIENDPLIKTTIALLMSYNQHVQRPLKEYTYRIDSLNRVYMWAQMVMNPTDLFYPDANHTLRLTYGKVASYSPKNSVTYHFSSSLKGIIDKSNQTDQIDYSLPHAFFQQANPDMPVCFIATNHTSGGNSGSPVLNSKGELIGVNFDRNWEGTMSDYLFDPSICRNIAVDIRYCLYLIKEMYHADYLLKEMNVD